MKLLLWTAAGLFSWIIGVGVMIWDFGEKDAARKSDCIIVLGAAVYNDKPSPVFKERIRHAIELFQQGQASTIIFTGGYGDGTSHAESAVGASYAVAQGIRNTAILIETKSRTTHQNLAEAKALMEAARLKSAIIVSDPLHLKRASVMADNLGILAVTSPTPTTRYRSLRTKLAFLVREIYFYTAYTLTSE